MPRLIIIFSVLLLFLSACASGPTQSLKNENEGSPEWVTKNCSMYFIQKSSHSVLCGVGSVAVGAEPNEALTVAKMKAKADLAKKISVRIESVLTDYRSTVSNGKGTVDTQHIEEVTREISAMVLSGVEMADSWTSPSGTLYVLVMIDPEKFRVTVSKAGIQEAEKDAIIKGSE